MEFICPFPDSSHHPPGPWSVYTRRSLRRHVNLQHQCDLRAELDETGRLRDVVRPCSPADLARRVSAIRRGQSRKSSRRGPTSAVVAASSVPGPGPSDVAAATLSSTVHGVDLSPGADLELPWDGAEFADAFLDLACPVAGVDWADILQGPAIPVSAAAASGPDSGPVRGQEPEGGPPFVAEVGSQRQEGQEPEGSQPTVSGAGSVHQAEAPPPLIEGFRVAETVAQAAIAAPRRGPLRLAYNVGRQLGLESPGDLHVVDAAVQAVVAYEQLLMDHLSDLAAPGLLGDGTAATSLATVVMEVTVRRGRPPGFVDLDPDQEQQAPRRVLPIEEAPIIVEDDCDDPFL